MGRAIVREPQVFLMDEPLSNLDAKLRVQMRGEISKLQQELGTTTLYVTHDQVEAMTMGERVAVMKDGVLQQIDSPQRLYDEPANLFVAGFIGTPPMNLLEATVDGDSVVVGGQRIELSAAALRRYSRLREFEGRAVVLGVRSEDIHPAAVRTDLPAIEARLELVEALGSTTMAFFRLDARSILAAAEMEAAEVLEAESAESIAASRPNLVAAFPPRFDLRLGDVMQISIDTANAHFFDESTGAALR